MGQHLKLKNLSMKNFMSFGNVEQFVVFEDEKMILILGENKDHTNNGSTADTRNGTGKSTICSAIAYALTDKPIGNIKKDNLVNNTNEKNMVVTLEFVKDGIDYKIVRGRKPNILKFYINGKDFDETEDESKGEMHDTQLEIDKIVGVSNDLLRIIMLMNGRDNSFLSLKAVQQRGIIEELLGITQLSEKSDKLKQLISDTKMSIEREDFKIETVKKLNDKTLSQLERLIDQSKKWDKSRDETITNLTIKLQEMADLDIENEKKLHEDLKTKDELLSELKIQKRSLSDYRQKLSKTEQEHNKLLDKANISIKENKCYICGHEITSDHTHIIEDILTDISIKEKQIVELTDSINVAEGLIDQIESLVSVYENSSKPFYNDIRDVWTHDTKMNNIAAQLEEELSRSNPYISQIESVKNENLEKIDETILTNLQNEKQHQEFLMKILTNKDSFVRKKIIDQSINYLNYRLDHYLTEIGLPHNVKFNNDLSVSIDYMGKELDFDNLSRGQATRLVIALNFAFRDVFESLHFPINLLMVDELIDNGLDGSGVDASIKIMQQMANDQKKSVYLISHKDEAKPRVDSIMTVVYENRFSNIQH